MERRNNMYAQWMDKISLKINEQDIKLWEKKHRSRFRRLLDEIFKKEDNK